MIATPYLLIDAVVIAASFNNPKIVFIVEDAFDHSLGTFHTQ
ncbi:Uncharacterised protein [Vibrio cholerae]|nr:Uncharacterised protein [Vibrio cholerae]